MMTAVPAKPLNRFSGGTRPVRPSATDTAGATAERVLVSSFDPWALVQARRMRPFASLDELARRTLQGSREGVELQLQAPEALPLRVQSLLRAIRNLLDNAATHGGAPVRLVTAQTAGHALLRVEDGGPGIDPAHWERQGFEFVAPGGAVDVVDSIGEVRAPRACSRPKSAARLSRARVRGVVDLGAVLEVEVRVDLGSELRVAVPEQLLHLDQARASAVMTSKYGGRVSRDEMRQDSTARPQPDR